MIKRIAASSPNFLACRNLRLARLFQEAVVKDKRKLRAQEEREEHANLNRKTIPAESPHGSYYSFSTGLPLIFDKERQELPVIQREYSRLTRSFALDHAEKKHIDFLYTLVLHGIMTKKPFLFTPFIENRLATRLSQFITLIKETNLKLVFAESLKEKRLQERVSSCSLRPKVIEMSYYRIRQKTFDARSKEFTLMYHHLRSSSKVESEYSERILLAKTIRPSWNTKCRFAGAAATPNPRNKRIYDFLRVHSKGEKLYFEELPESSKSAPESVKQKYKDNKLAREALEGEGAALEEVRDALSNDKKSKIGSDVMTQWSLLRSCCQDCKEWGQTAREKSE